MCVTTVVAQYYDTDVNKDYVILGNSIVLRCHVPSFVADFVDVLSWHTDLNETYYPSDHDGGHTFATLLGCIGQCRHCTITTNTPMAVIVQ